MNYWIIKSRHVINVSEEISNYFPNEMKYLRIPVSDTNDASLEEYFPMH